MDRKCHAGNNTNDKERTVTNKERAKKKDMKNVEFYFLLDDYTWNTNFIDIPDDIVGDMTIENEEAAIDYVYKNKKLSKNVAIVGLYSWGEECEE